METKVEMETQKEKGSRTGSYVLSCLPPRTSCPTSTPHASLQRILLVSCSRSLERDSVHLRKAS